METAPVAISKHERRRLGRNGDRHGVRSDHGLATAPGVNESLAGRHGDAHHTVVGDVLDVRGEQPEVVGATDCSDRNSSNLDLADQRAHRRQSDHWAKPASSVDHEHAWRSPLEVRCALGCDQSRAEAPDDDR
jgi:hypothetical protein